MATPRIWGLEVDIQEVGGRMGGMVPGTQFNPEAIQAANGIFGNVNARQAAVGAWWNI